MAGVITIKVEGLEQVQRALVVAPQIAMPPIKRATEQSLLLIQGKVQPYPKQPSRFRAKTFNVYVRGLGHMTRASFDDGGNWLGPREGPRGGQPRFTSEDLGQKWTTKVQVMPRGFLGILGNTASYAEAVQGEKQAPYHAQTGWVKLSTAARQMTGKIQQLFNNAAMAIAKALRRAMM